MLVEQLREPAGVAAERSGDDLAVEAHGIDVGFQGAPARKAVLPGDVELGLVQLGCRLVRAQVREPLLGGLLEPGEIGTWGKSLGHRTPSFLKRPASAALGQERRCEQSIVVTRWVQPFTRTVGRLFDQRRLSRALATCQCKVKAATTGNPE